MRAGRNYDKKATVVFISFIHGSYLAIIWSYIYGQAEIMKRTERASKASYDVG